MAIANGLLRSTISVNCSRYGKQVRRILVNGINDCVRIGVCGLRPKISKLKSEDVVLHLGFGN